MNDPVQDIENKTMKNITVRDAAILTAICLVFLISGLFAAIKYPSYPVGDEIYYLKEARTYLTSNQIDGNYIHPPVAKMIIGLFIGIYGDNVFGWRAGSIMFGMLTIIATFLFGRALFKNTSKALLASGLLTADLVFIVQSRLGMLDIFQAFFIVMGLYFSLLFISGEQELPVLHKYSILSAAFIGLATTCKLNGVTGVAASAGLYIAVMLLAKRENWLKKTAYLLLLNIVIVGLIYVISFVPLFLKGESLMRLIPINAYYTHIAHKYTHHLLMMPYEMPLAITPMFHMVYYSEHQTCNSIGAMANLFFWWSFLIFLGRSIYLSIKYRQIKDIAPVINYLALYLFWFLSFQVVDGHFSYKGGFIFYMIPCIPFMAIITADAVGHAFENNIGKINAVLYLGVLLYFAYRYYPLTSGETIPVYKFYHILNVPLVWLIRAVVMMSAQLFLPDILKLIHKNKTQTVG